MYQIKQFLWGSFKKVEDTASLGHLKKSDVHGSQATIPNGKYYSHG